MPTKETLLLNFSVWKRKGMRIVLGMLLLPPLFAWVFSRLVSWNLVWGSFIFLIVVIMDYVCLLYTMSRIAIRLALLCPHCRFALTSQDRIDGVVLNRCCPKCRVEILDHGA